MANFDSDLHIRDMYFQFVEMENQVEFWQVWGLVDGRFSWIDGFWKRKLIYKEDSLVYRPFT